MFIQLKTIVLLYQKLYLGIRVRNCVGISAVIRQCINDVPCVSRPLTNHFRFRSFFFIILISFYLFLMTSTSVVLTSEHVTSYCYEPVYSFIVLTHMTLRTQKCRCSYDCIFALTLLSQFIYVRLWLCLLCQRQI